MVLVSGFATFVNPTAQVIQDARRDGIAHEVVRWGDAPRFSSMLSPLDR